MQPWLQSHFGDSIASPVAPPELTLFGHVSFQIVAVSVFDISIYVYIYLIYPYLMNT